MKSQARTVAEYLAALPDDRRAAITALRKLILANLDRDYEEGMMWGMIGYAVPHRVWPLGYHCDPSKPLMMAALASQKNNLTVYLMPVYSDPAERAWFQKAWAATGKKLDMGGCCIRFRRLEDAALDVIAAAIRRTPARAYVARYIELLASTGRGPDGRKLKTSPAASKTRAAPAGKPARPAVKAARGSAGRAAKSAPAAARPASRSAARAAGGGVRRPAGRSSRG